MNHLIKLNNGAIVSCGDCNYYDVYIIDIDEDRIELSDENGFVIGTISRDTYEDIEILEYDNDGRISEDDTMILTL